MGLDKTGTSYRSFDYLERDVDHRGFDLAPELDRVPSLRVELDADQERRVERLQRDHIMVSMHEHLGVFPADVFQTPHWVREARVATAFEGLAASSWDAVFDNLLDGICTIESRGGWKWTEVLHDLGMRLCDLAHQDFIIHCENVDDIRRAHSEGRIAWVASIEGAAMIENELDRIEVLYGFGVRALGIAYSEANALGSGLKEPQDGGLTVFGRRAVERMNKVGMLIDCSHCGDRTTLDTIEVSEHPIVLSHIGARALWDSNRLAPDHVIEACAAKGGLIGIEAAPHTTLSPSHPAHSLESVMDHFEHVRSLVGIDHVTFGPDTVYGDHVGLHHVYAANLSIASAQAKRARRPKAPPEPTQLEAVPSGKRPAFEKVAFVDGLENPTEGSHNLVRRLVKAGYSDENVAKVMGGNALRVLERVWV